MSSIGPGRLDERRADDDVFVLDIRPDSEYQGDHIRGSYNAPVYHDLRDGAVDALDPHLDTLPEQAEIVTVCKAGIVARTATDYLESEGYDATTLTGGYAGWRQYERNTVLYRLAALVRRLAPR
ncbi:rhodanese-like domain-containing protein [Halorientalis pallida]|uniref:Rhodanese-like domain-containing protein n=1 Tax=Halorientalis pallida TaxID=2479928 RepID=A0A498KSU9_9EURY|nr:rhodanese-like domain-containing protein [Halorientalis pallida]RXK47000.1 rhodanese-like domain-containing protein [Halorientalis pallida]